MKIISTVLVFILSMGGTKATSSSSVRGHRPEELSSSEEIQYPLDLDSNCPVFRDSPDGNERLAQQMIDATLPCGTYQSRGCEYEVIPANVDHPDSGLGEIKSKKNYIVQFDIGVHKNIKDRVEGDHENWDKGQGRDCIGCTEEGGEQCLEIIVEGRSNANGGCAGMCGPQCFGSWWAKDCMKHDMCTAYKALIQRDSVDWSADDGFCYDIDCGDEAAQTVLNCWIEKSWTWDKPITCERSNFSDPRAYGHWIYATNAMNEGPCHNFLSWSSGQGLPDKIRIRNPYEKLAYLESKGVDVSRGYMESEEDIDISHTEK